MNLFTVMGLYLSIQLRNKTEVLTHSKGQIFWTQMTDIRQKSLIFNNLESQVQTLNFKEIKVNSRSKMERLETDWTVIRIKIAGKLRLP